MLTKIKLYGILAEHFGKEHEFNIASPIEVINALKANFPTFEQVFIRGSYRIYQGEDNLAEPIDFVSPISEGTIKIIPVVAGSGSDGPSIGKIIIGVILVAVAWYFTGPGGGTAMSEAAFGGAIGGMTWAGLVGMVGVSLIFSGVSGLLFKPPDAGDEGEKEASYAFNGPVNTVNQGNIVPVGYGTLWIGSLVISGGMTVDQLIPQYEFTYEPYDPVIDF